MFRNKALLAHLALFAANLIYGANYTIAKEVMPEYILPFGFIVLRVTGAVLLFLLFHQLFLREKTKWKDHFLLIICAFFGVALNQMMFFKGLSMTSPINAGLIMVTTPILVLVISAFAGREQFTLLKMLGVTAGAIGAGFLILSGDYSMLEKGSMTGDMLVLINALSYGIYLVIVKPLMQKYHPVTVLKWIFLYGFIFVLPFGFNEVLQISWNDFSMNIWLATLFIVVFVTFLAYLLNNYALRELNPTAVSIYIYLQPLLAALIALSLNKDKLLAVHVAAGILIFLGVYMVNRKEAV